MATSGFKYGQSTGGGQFLKPQDANRLYEKFVSIGARGGTPMSQADTAARYFDDVTKKLGSTLDDINRPLTAAEKTQLKKDITNAIANNPEIYGKTEQANELLRVLKGTKDVKGLEKLRQRADKIGWNLNNAGKSKKAAEARTFREAVDGFITNSVDLDDSYKALKGDWSDAKDILELTSKAKSTGGVPVPFGGGLKVPNTGIKSRVARRMGTRGGGMSFAGGKEPGFIRRAVGSPMGKQLGLRGLSGGGGAPPPNNPADIFAQLGLTEESVMQAAQESGISPEMILPALGITPDMLAQDMGGFGQQGAVEQQGQDPMAQQMGGFNGQQSNGYTIPREAMVNAMMADMQATGGKNIDKLIKFFEFANYDVLNNSGAGAELSTAQKTELSKMDTVEANISQLMQQFQLAGGGQGFGGLIKRNITSKIPGVETDAANFEGLRSALIAPLARAISGEVGVLTDKDVKRAEGLLPKLTDTPEQAAQRMQNLMNLINMRRQNVHNSNFGAQEDNGVALEQALGGFTQ